MKKEKSFKMRQIDVLEGGRTSMRIIKDSTPSADGFRMPAEYEKHEGCIMIFPERSDSWQYGG